MTPFVRVTGIGAPLMLNNIDTDQITPGHQIMKVQKTGFGPGLFWNWRFLKEGVENPAFVLNQGPYRRATFLITGENFGCGSSREWSAWALRDFGIRAVISPSFGAIFTSNCFMNGMAPIVLNESVVAALAAQLTPDAAEMTVDIERSVIVSPNGDEFAFRLPEMQRERLLEGLDAIDATHRREPMIAEFQERDAQRRPWIYSV